MEPMSYSRRSTVICSKINRMLAQKNEVMQMEPMSYSRRSTVICEGTKWRRQSFEPPACICHYPARIGHATCHSPPSKLCYPSI